MLNFDEVYILKPVVTMTTQYNILYAHKTITSLAKHIIIIIEVRVLLLYIHKYKTKTKVAKDTQMVYMTVEKLSSWYKNIYESMCNTVYQWWCMKM